MQTFLSMLRNWGCHVSSLKFEIPNEIGLLLPMFIRSVEKSILTFMSQVNSFGYHCLNSKSCKIVFYNLQRDRLISC